MRGRICVCRIVVADEEHHNAVLHIHTSHLDSIKRSTHFTTTLQDTMSGNRKRKEAEAAKTKGNNGSRATAEAAAAGLYVGYV